MTLNWYKRSLLCLSVCGSLVSSLSAATLDDSDDVDQKDINAVREWINTKRQVTVREMGGALSLSGEVRTEFQSTSETLNGVKQRGHDGAVVTRDGLHIPQNAFDIEVNIMLDYRADKTWGSIKLEFDNDAGIFTGTLNKLKLERAYWGVRAVDTEESSFDIELGRRRMSSIVDSKLQFGNFFDGAWFRYDYSYDAIGDLYLHAGVFIINENKNHFGYLGELGILNIAGTGLYSKYSLTDWNTKNQHNAARNHRFDFLVNQLTVGYKFYPSRLKKIIQLYAAGLINANAHRIEITNNTKQSWGTYIGFAIGELKKKGDWAVDVNYQILAAQCVPDFDVQGIGTGNAANAGFYTVKMDDTSAATTRKNAGGNVNYRGFQMTLDYLLTNQINIQQSWQQSVTLDKSIGPFHRYKQYEIEFIYGF